jgi:prevent-host-death family protein
MMAVLPEVIPISDLRLRQGTVLAKLDKGPVILTQRNRARAVLVDVEQWQRLMENLEDLEDALLALQAKATDREPPAPLEDVLAELNLVEKEHSA